MWGFWNSPCSWRSDHPGGLGGFDRTGLGWIGGVWLARLRGQKASRISPGCALTLWCFLKFPQRSVVAKGSHDVANFFPNRSVNCGRNKKIQLKSSEGIFRYGQDEFLSAKNPILWTRCVRPRLSTSWGWRNLSTPLTWPVGKLK